MLAELQRIPRGGEFVVYEHALYRVDVELNRIIKVKVELLDKTNGIKPAGKAI